MYKPWSINWNNWKDHPLKVVRDPQNPNPKINLYLLEIGNELIKPNKKQPIIFTIKISSICHLIRAAGIVPIEIKKKLLFSKKLSIYRLPNKKPNTIKIIPKDIEIRKNLKAI